MDFLDKLERRFGKYAISNLMLYILLGNAIVFLLQYILRINMAVLLSFNLGAILNGQVWRLITFIFVPAQFGGSFLGIFGFAIVIFLYYSIGSSLERAWGTFKFNVYYLSGAVFTAIACSILNLGGAPYVVATAQFINLTLFLAFATMFPNLEFLLYFIIPVKAKYMAILYFILLIPDFIYGGIGNQLFIIISLLNYILFFGLPLLRGKTSKTQRQFHKQKRANIPVGSSDPIKVAFHHCHICGKTELTDPDMEFRYCSKCNGNYEYCMDHIRNHEHIQ